MENSRQDRTFAGEMENKSHKPVSHQPTGGHGLGNVHITLSDYCRKEADGLGVVYYSQINSASDYYPFGQLLTDGNYSSGSYRFGFNGKEMDNEVKGIGNQYDYGFRIYSPRIAKFLSVDPLTASYPWLTPYQFGSNTPIAAIDIDGLEAYLSIYGAGIARRQGKTFEHNALFKMESERDVKWGNANSSHNTFKGKRLIQLLENKTKEEGSVGYLSVFSHSNNSNIILDNGQFDKQTLGVSQWQGYSHTDLETVFENDNIKFHSDALILFAGCNTARQKINGKKTDNVAEYITKKYGVATIGADGYTSPQGSNNYRKADYNYYLFMKDDNGNVTKTEMGKKLNPYTIERARLKVDKPEAMPTRGATQIDIDSQSDDV
ncbi:MAG: hypothetical protein K9J21_06480 [Bacteroidales bacterium]|nr:hypothetical protein [Bacteroidales bacterium]